MTKLENGKVKSESNAITATKDVIELYSKLAAFIIVCIYLVGFLAVNKRLYQLGVSDFSILQARFIYTGALALIFIVVDYLFIVAGIWFIRRLSTIPELDLSKSNFQKSRGEHITKLLFVVVIYLFGILLILFPWITFLYFFSPYDCSKPITLDMYIWEISTGSIFADNSELKESVMLYLICSAVALLSVWIIRRTYQFLQVANQEREEYRRGFTVTPLSFFMIFLFCLILLNAYLSMFGTYIYPQIPEQFGGGRPKLISLVFTDSAQEAAEKLGLVEDNEIVSGVENLLFEGSETYVIERSGQTIQINKSMIQAIEIIGTGGCGI